MVLIYVFYPNDGVKQSILFNGKQEDKTKYFVTVKASLAKPGNTSSQTLCKYVRIKFVFCITKFFHLVQTLLNQPLDKKMW